MPPTSNTIQADVVSVAELFENAGQRLRIPAYQRRYAWKSNQVVALCKDVLAAVTEKRREYHIGTLILHKSDDFFDVVDGQQRLTSICLLLSNPETYRLAAESANGDTSPSYGKIGKAEADKLLDEVCACGIKLDDVRAFLPKCTFVRIVVDNVEEAFQLFDTQNGRGKPLTPDNLLKAYHFHEMTHSADAEPDKAWQYTLESEWEGINKGAEQNESREQRLRGLDGPLLPHLIGEHLFRLRRWCRGDDAFYTFFDNTHLGEFKGVTIGDGHGVPPCHAEAFLRRFFRRNYGRLGLRFDGLPSRLDGGERASRFLDPFQSISQPIVNGEEFFLYILNCATIYRMLFGNDELESLAAFRKFHWDYCINYPEAWHLGDRYARHVFESLCLLLFDRFGHEGLMAHYRLLYRFSYWERSHNARLWYQSAGERFATRAVHAMMASETFAELNDVLAVLRAELDEACKAEWPHHLFSDGWNLVNGQCQCN